MAECCDEEPPKLTDELLSNYSILENGPFAISGSWTYLPTTGALKWSPGMYRLFNLSQGTKVRPDIYIDYSVDSHRHIARKIVNAIHEQTAFDEQLQINVENQIRTLRVIGAPRDVSGERRFAGIDLDLTDRNDFDPLQLKDPSYEQLKKADKAKSAFFNNLSHEFQNPVTLVLESTNKVIRKIGSDLPDSVIRELHHIQRNAVRMEKLVSTLSDFTHLEQRRQTALYLPTDICKLTNEVSAAFRATIENAGLGFTIRCEKIHEQVYIDHQMFETILSNLLSNAFKFTIEGGITVSVCNGRKHVKISVADTGNGINPANQKKIFQRFAKFETAAARSLDGMGIGLPLVKDLVEIHGGTISVESTPKKGSEFIVSFPKGTEHIPTDQLALSGIDERKGNSLRGTIGEIESWPGRDTVPSQNVNDHRMVPTIVVAESDREMRGYIVRSLESKYKVLEADNGQQVLDLIGSGFIPDLVIADAAMPKVDGFELLSSIKSTNAQTQLPVILLTMKSTADEEVKGLYYGADDYLVKPFSSRELLARVETRIEISQAGKKPVQSLTKANSVLEERVHHYMKELEEKNTKLTSVNEELTGLTFAASHDLREPMRKIRLFIGRIIKEEKQNLSPNAEHYFTRILSFVQTLNDLVNDISLYANFNDTIGPTSNIDLQIMLTSLMEFLTPMLHEKGAKIRFEVAEGLTGDYDQVRQAIYNLVSNSLKFNKKDVPIEISITGKLVPGTLIDSQRADKKKIYYLVTVTDNGIGIDPSHYKQIFELFRKLHKPTAYPGTGIGLTLVRRIMENHNGFVTVESTTDNGSTFKCFFPAALVN